jgi:hypothetical protein
VRVEEEDHVEEDERKQGRMEGGSNLLLHLMRKFVWCAK